MLLHTSYFLLSASILLSGGVVADGRRLLTQPNLFEFEDEHQSTTTRLMVEEKSKKSSKKSKNSKAKTKKKKTPAASLDVFKNIDPTKFKWVNSDNIKPGATTCGFLHTNLGAEPGVNYPIIKVYICVKFAVHQPAPSGNIVTHCGGPGSASDCGIGMGSAYSIGKENADNYNIIGIDQRGMGRSWPSFYHEECDAVSLQYPYGEKYTAADIQEYLDGRKDDVERCWGCTDCDYTFNDFEQPDGEDPRSFHFLEYSGTRELAEDLERFRALIEAPALSLYGISYGTTVMGTYATIFPNNVDKFILDSNSTPSSTSEQYARSKAVGTQLRYDYLKYSCWAARLKNRDSCPVEPDNIAKCAENAEYLTNFISKWYNTISVLSPFENGELDEFPTSISDILKSYFKIYKSFSDRDAFILNEFGAIDFLLLLLTKDPVTMGKLCSTDDADWATLSEFIEKYDPPQKGAVGLGSIDCDNYDQPSVTDKNDQNYDGKCFDVSNGDVTSKVRGQDKSGGVSAYNDDVFINLVLAFQDEYGTEYIRPRLLYLSQLAINYYWPKNVPLPILGSPLIEGIVAGVLYDNATPYAWSSEMRGNFPSTTLLTSQSIYHGISTGANDPAYGPCQKYITKYLETGVIDLIDGTVCGQQFPYFSGKIRK